MPVVDYYSQKEPVAEAEIWRFLDLRKFRDLMASEELSFRRADLFDDETEGLPPEQYVQGVLRLDPWDIRDQTVLNNHLGSLAESRERHYITCWHLHRKETLAMWEGYGHDGVAIVSRYDLLKAALGGLIDQTHLGLIQYGTSHLTNRFNEMEFITSKQLKYEPECEVRAILTCSDPLAGGNRNIDLNNIPHPRPLPMNPRHPWVPECKRRRIVLKELVQTVVISPWAEADNVEEIKLWNELKGFSPPRQSELRGEMTMSLEDYREHMGIKKAPPEPERVATEHELNHFYEEISTLTPERVRFLYRQRWEKCRLESASLPSTLDLQYLEATMAALKGMERRHDSRVASKPGLQTDSA
jgi:hypothetical protein